MSKPTNDALYEDVTELIEKYEGNILYTEFTTVLSAVKRRMDADYVLARTTLAYMERIKERIAALEAGLVKL